MMRLLRSWGHAGKYNQAKTRMPAFSFSHTGAFNGRRSGVRLCGLRRGELAARRRTNTDR